MLPQVMVNGLMFSAMFSLVGLGLSIVYGVGRIMNWAHGELYMLGAVGLWLLAGPLGLPFYLAAPISIAGVLIVGFIIERSIYKPLRGLHLPGFVASYGVLIMLQGGVTIGLGGLARSFPPLISGSVTFAGASLSLQRLVTLPLAVLGVFFCLWFMQRTKYGTAIRAITQDEGAARMHGMRMDTLASIAMALGTGLAAYAGVLAAPLFTIEPHMGSFIMWNAWMAVIIGGRANLGGTLFSSIILGYMNSFIITYFDSYTAVIATALFLVFVLAVRPRGLWTGVEA